MAETNTLRRSTRVRTRAATKTEASEPDEGSVLVEKTEVDHAVAAPKLEKKQSRKRKAPAAAAAAGEEEEKTETKEDSVEPAKCHLIAVGAAGEEDEAEEEVQPVKKTKAKKVNTEGMPQDGEAPRLRAWKRTCPAGVQARISRARTQRLYLINRTTDASRCGCPQHSPHHSEFAVLGSTGNVYQVVICTIPTCTCPDFLKGSHCKHILFVMLKVLRIDPKSKLLYQPSLLPSELASIFANAPADPAAQARAPAAVRKAYAKLTGEGAAAEGEEEDAPAGGGVTRKAIDGNDCAICYEPLSESDQLEWCTTGCGNNLHKDCFSRWAQSQRTKGEKVTCVYCRAEWITVGPAAGAAVAAKGVCQNEGYTNLAQLSGQDMYRSSYFSEGYYWSKYRRWYD